MMAAKTVSEVIVCTGSLCTEQDSGSGALDLLADLRSRELPFAVVESPCLNACGRCAMVAIDFEDGSSSLVGGVDRCLLKLGLDKLDSTRLAPSPPPPPELDALERMRASAPPPLRPAWLRSLEQLAGLVAEKT